MATNYDKVMENLGRPKNWREEGWDTIATMKRVYERDDNNQMVCPWPHCHSTSALKTDLEFFTHVHSPHKTSVY